jgi:hypothetical protein
MVSHLDRVATNEAAFREANERMHAWPERQHEPPTAQHKFLCECGDSQCEGRLSLTRAEYEAIRADDLRFAVLVGHVFPEAERVVSEHDGRYLVVEKSEEVRAVVDRTYGSRTHAS